MHFHWCWGVARRWGHLWRSSCRQHQPERPQRSGLYPGQLGRRGRRGRGRRGGRRHVWFRHRRTRNRGGRHHSLRGHQWSRGGQAAIATENALTGQAITEGLGRPEDILRDAAVGAVVSGVGRSMDLALIRARYPGYYSRYISEGELQAIEETGLLRGGRPDETYFSLQTYTSRLRKPLLV